jgi:hypothetical protein
VTVVFLGRDLMTATRLIDAAARAGVDVRRIDAPADLPPPGNVKVLVVDWGERESDWGQRIASWASAAPESARPTMLLFGPHVDLAAHAAAKAAGLGPMRARSTLASEIARLLG